MFTSRRSPLPSCRSCHRAPGLQMDTEAAAQSPGRSPSVAGSLIPDAGVKFQSSCAPLQQLVSIYSVILTRARAKLKLFRENHAPQTPFVVVCLLVYAWKHQSGLPSTALLSGSSGCRNLHQFPRAALTIVGLGLFSPAFKQAPEGQVLVWLR